MYRVTYYNETLNERKVLIDKIDLDTAEQVLFKMGNPKDTFHYLPKCKIEEDTNED